MKTIIVLTDFSRNAFAAALYAGELASQKGWKLLCLHANSPYYSIYSTGTVGTAWFDIVKANEDAMKDMVEEIQKKYPSLAISGENREGGVAEVAVQSAKAKKAVLIVMGTRGGTALKYAFMGSNTFDVVQKSSIPVLAVPDNIRRFNLDHVGFAINYQAVELTTLEAFCNLIAPKEITLFHLYEEKKRDEEKKLQEWQDRYQKIVANSTSTLHFKLALTRDLPTGVNRLIKKENLNALVMTPVHKTFFNRLFSRALVRVIARRMTVPVFFMKQA